MAIQGEMNAADMEWVGKMILSTGYKIVRGFRNGHALIGLPYSSVQHPITMDEAWKLACRIAKKKYAVK